MGYNNGILREAIVAEKAFVYLLINCASVGTKNLGTSEV